MRVPSTARTRVEAVLAGLAALVAISLLAAPSCEPTEAGGAPSTVRVRSATALSQAYASASPGTTILLAPGVYEPRQLRRPTGTVLSQPIVLRPEAGAAVEVRNLDVAGPSLHLRDLHLTGIIRFRAAAIGGRVEGSRIDPGNLIVEADRVAVVGNTLRGPPDRDALDIGATDGTGPYDVEVRDNRIGPGTLSPGSKAHVDCLQVMSATDLRVVGNLLYDCPAQTLLVKADLGPIERVQIVRNALRGCTPRTEACPAYMTLQIVPGAHPMRDIEVTGNSIAGAFRGVAGIPGVVLGANVIDRIEAGCEYATRPNVVGSARCTLPPGNVIAAPRFVDAVAEPPDLRPAPDSPAVDRGDPEMVPDREGRTAPCGARWDAGADEHC